ncbi:MAG: hypothetical protein ACRDV9_12685 [Acidimicrobiia bacterium]
MPRRRRRGRPGTRAPEDQSAALLFPDQVHAPEGMAVRAVQPYQAVKRYRCPGCDQEILPGTGHLVVVPEDAPEDRRHWHTSCWRRHLRSRGRRSS